MLAESGGVRCLGSNGFFVAPHCISSLALRPFDVKPFQNIEPIIGGNFT